MRPCGLIGCLERDSLYHSSKFSGNLRKRRARVPGRKGYFSSSDAWGSSWHEPRRIKWHERAPKWNVSSWYNNTRVQSGLLPKYMTGRGLLINLFNLDQDPRLGLRVNFDWTLATFFSIRTYLAFCGPPSQLSGAVVSFAEKLLGVLRSQGNVVIFDLLWFQQETAYETFWERLSWAQDGEEHRLEISHALYEIINVYVSLRSPPP